jgi:hypothetical protein
VTGVELDITPEPTPEERAAIGAAVVSLLAREAPSPSAWWRAGVTECVEGDEQDED